MALGKDIIIDTFQIRASYWRVDSISSDRRTDITTVALSGYTDETVATQAKTDSKIRALRHVTINLPKETDPLIQPNPVGYIYTQIKLLPEWASAQDI